MLNNILNLDGVTVLNKKQQKLVNGGSDDGCCVNVTYDDGYRYRSCGLSVSDAQGIYGDTFEDLGGFGGASVTGYCCASC